MTFKEKIKQIYVERGILESDANAIVAAVMQDKANSAMNHRWNDDIKGYPKTVLMALWPSICHNALAYIDVHCSKAWFRSLFV